MHIEHMKRCLNEFAILMLKLMVYGCWVIAEMIICELGTVFGTEFSQVIYCCSQTQLLMSRKKKKKEKLSPFKKCSAWTENKNCEVCFIFEIFFVLKKATIHSFFFFNLNLKEVS